MSEELTSRKIRPSDLASLLAFDESGDTWRNFERPTGAWIDHMVNRPLSHGLVLELGGRMVAVAQLDVGADGSASVGLAVHPSYRRRGIGESCLLEHLAPLARALECTALAAWVDPANRSSIALCTRAGFEGRDDAPDSDGLLEFRLSLEPK